MRNISDVSLLIGGPSDTDEFRFQIKELIEKWNANHGRALGLRISPERWETHSAPLMGSDAQSIVNMQMVDECDGMIAVFSWKLGTPTTNARSGTIEEIERFLSSSPPKPVSILFAAREGEPPAHAQTEDLILFEKECFQKGLVGAFSTEAELRDVIERVLPQQLRQITAADPTTTAPVPAGLPVVSAEEEVQRLGKAAGGHNGFALLELGKLDEGIALLRRDWERDAKGRSWESVLALGLSYAGIVGESTIAFARLDLMFADTPPSTAELAFIFARSLDARGKRRKALAILESFEAAHGMFALACLTLALRILCRRGHVDSAMERFGTALRTESEPRIRAIAVREFAQVLEDTGNLQQAIDFRELAQDIQPSDATARSRLADLYLVKAPESPVPLVHFTELREVEDTTTHVTNMAWYEDRSGFPIASVGHYREAADRDEPHAISNLALSYLAAGFVADARQVLRTAYQRGITDPLLERAMGAIVSAEETERDRLGIFRDRIAALRTLRINQALARIAERVNADTLSGSYIAKPSFAHLQLICEKSGSCSGSFQYEFGSAATLIGKVDGRLLTFTWTSDSPQTSVIAKAMGLSLPPWGGTVKSGFGALIWSTPDRLKGYWDVGAGPITEISISSLTEWSLRKGDPFVPSIQAVGNSIPIAGLPRGLLD